MITDLDRSGFSLSLRVLSIEQNFRLVIVSQPSAVIRGFNNNMEHNATQSTDNRLHQNLHMFGADDRTSIRDSENLLLDKTESLVGGRSLEQLGDRRPDQGLMVRCCMSMTFCNPVSESFSIT
jgi:hypothetical protein